MSKTRVPAVENWFTTDETAPALLGARGAESGSYYWPTAVAVSGNPSAPGEAREPVELSDEHHPMIRDRGRSRNPRHGPADRLTNHRCLIRNVRKQRGTPAGRLP